jgi:hypothetical protein
MILKVLIAIVVLGAIAAGTMLWLGARLPVRHRIAVAASFMRSPEQVFDVIADIPAAVSWRSGMKSSTLVDPSADGTPRFRQTDGNGTITYRIETSERPVRFVTRIDDPKLPFGGTWSISIARDGEVTKVEIIEDGDVRSSLFRFFARYVFGYYRSAESYLVAPGKKFGDEVHVQRINL